MLQKKNKNKLETNIKYNYLNNCCRILKDREMGHQSSSKGSKV
jgi:hypothetical protein